MAVLGHREVPIPDHVDIYHLTREIEATDKTALESVIEVDEEKKLLEKEAEELACFDDHGNSPPFIKSDCLIANCTFNNFY